MSARSAASGLYAYGTSRDALRGAVAPTPGPAPDPETDPTAGGQEFRDAWRATTANGRFYVNVQAELNARGWPARELARRAGLSPNFLTRVGQGRWIALESAVKVADVLGVPLGDLVAEGGGRSRKPGGDR